jgi:UDP-N-acetylglucosamine diphosphorylase/glucosamine-1-phosphate N-acetyltransferase
MRLALFEDAQVSGLLPLTWLRPAFEIVCGQFSLRERLVRRLNVSHWGVFIRDSLEEVYKEEFPEAEVNTAEWLGERPTLFVNGRWLPELSDFERLGGATSHEAGVIDGRVAWIVIEPALGALLDANSLAAGLTAAAQKRNIVPVQGKLLEYPWDAVSHNPRQLHDDFQLLGLDRDQDVLLPDEIFKPQAAIPDQVAVLGDPHNVYVDRLADVDPFVVLDARRGPISVDARVHIQAFSRLEGPCHVSHGTQLFRANIRGGTTIGPVCRVGGEIEASILHGYANKYHDGFLGHSYVCPWVNLGAETTNSDLKNDYSNVAVPLTGEMIDTGQRKVGCFLGDHTKTALGSLFNTGSSVGVLAMVLPGGELLPKHIPSFCRVWHGVLDDGLRLEGALETAAAAMERRNVQLTPAQEELLRAVYAATSLERARAIERYQARMERRGKAGASPAPYQPQPEICKFLQNARVAH